VSRQPPPWPTLALVFPSVDAPWEDADGRPRRHRREMAPGELAATVDVLLGVPAAVETWSEGNARLHPFVLRVVEEPLRRLSDVGDHRYWVAPQDCRQILQRLGAPGRYASILVIWPAGNDLPLCGWGCSVGPGPEAHGAGFSSMISDGWIRYPRLPDPEEGFVHEWLHQVEATFRSLGCDEAVVPPLHDAETLTSCRPPSEPPYGGTYRSYHDRVETWQPWYHDYMTGQVRRPSGGCFGLTREVWLRRRS
jgi:hypothetical protein